VAPQTTASRPGRLLAALIALIVILLAVAVGKYALQPTSWHKGFKVGLGLDLSSGTTVTLKAVSSKSESSSQFQSAMNTAVSIMENRVNGAGFTGASVVPEGTDIITVSVPGKNTGQVVKLVGTTAQLRFRQVLLIAPNTSTATPTPTPSATPSPSPSATPSPSASTKAKASPSPTSSSAALGQLGTGSAAHGLTVTARRLAGAASGAAKAKPKASASPGPSASPSPSPSPSSSQAAAPKLSTTADGEGDASLLTATAKAEFNKLNCADKDWQSKIYGNNPNSWDNVSSQVVACYQGEKYALDKAKVTGQMLDLGGASVSLNTNGTWQVNLSFDGAGTKAFGALTSQMFSKYAGSSSDPQNYFAIVLDGVPASIAYVQSAIPDGKGEITGSFTQSQATYLTNVLNYGALPLTFQKESAETITAQLGSSQLHAGLVAAAIGLFLVVVYSFIYYRGLGLVSVSSLAIAALLSYLSVVLLSKYYDFTLSLAGIAGLIVAIGITADSFVVFFERLRDEVRDGRSLRAAVERGWQRARRTILVSDTVSFLAAALLWKFSVGDVKGFAFTLGLTTVVDIVVVFLFTKPMVTLLARTKFYGDGHRLSGLDPARLGARAPWRGSIRPPARPAARPAGASPGGASSAAQARTNPKEA
jgi:preprotein translocase subunit SecD